MAKKETIIRMAAVTLGLGLAINAYRDLGDPKSPWREKVLKFTALRTGYGLVQGSKEEVDAFYFKLPGPRLASALSADILAEPHQDWMEMYVRRPALSGERDPITEEVATVTYIQVKRADTTHLPGLYVLKEHGSPFHQIQVPFMTDPTVVTTVRSYLVGENHIPLSSTPPFDKLTY